MTPRRRRMAFAFFAAAIVLGAMFAVSSEHEESDAIEPITIAFIGSIILAAVAGGVVGYAIGQATSDGQDDQARRAEAANLQTALAYALPNIAGSLDNYRYLWSLTSEHWIRQAELAAAAAWSQGAQYDPGRILDGSGEYKNAAVMTRNAALQFNVTFDGVNDRMKQWGDYDWYKDGKMKVRLSAGTSKVEAGSNDELKVMAGTAVRNVSSGQDAVYFAGGAVYASKSARMVGEDGSVISLSRGWNTDIEEIKDFPHPGIYYLDHGVDYCGSFVQPIHKKSAILETGIAAVSGDKHLFVTYDGTSLSSDGRNNLPLPEDKEESGFMIGVVTQDGDVRSDNGLNEVLVQFWRMMNSVREVQLKVNQSAKTVWDIYSEAGEASAYLSTLTVPDTYLNVKWTDDQKRLVSVLAMDQLASYWKDHSGKLKTEGYEMTKGSMILYCRGTVLFYGKTGSGTDSYSVAENVVFTPIFYQDTELKKGANSIPKSCFVIIWGKGDSLNSFDTASAKDASVQFAPSGAVLNVTEMMYDGEYVNNVKLDVSEVEWVDPHRINDHGPTPYEESNDLGELVRLILIILGGAMVVTAFSRGSMTSLILGMGLILVGVFFAEDIEKLLEEYLGWRWEWPS